MATMKTVQARFVQTAPDGTQRMGTFYLDRPGKMRFDYDPPVTDVVVADGIQLYYYDGELRQTSSAPVGQTLADFLLRENVRMSGDVQVVRVQEGGGLTQLTLTQKADPAAGTMTLGFTSQPFGLKKWRVTDGGGQITEVELFDVVQNPALPGSLFVFRDPQNPKGKYN
jgi:outer membrane lipoprotein-sorting protein